MKFTKMHGLGNDYIYFDCTKKDIKDPSSLSILLSKYHFGIGSDGIVMIMNSDVADFRMRMFNADGSEGKMCGNATRCIGKYVYEKGLTKKTDLTLETLSGIKYLSLKIADNKVIEVSVNMGKADFTAKNIPVICDEQEFINRDFKGYKATCVSMGNPHCVIFTDSISDLPLSKIGSQFEKDSIFPQQVNTEFVKILSPTVLEMRVWERGSGETMACGTGACAVVSAAVKNKISPADTDITINLLGGSLKIRYNSDGTVIMTGSADFVFEGEILLEESKCYE